MYVVENKLTHSIYNSFDYMLCEVNCNQDTYCLDYDIRTIELKMAKINYYLASHDLVEYINKLYL